MREVESFSVSLSAGQTQDLVSPNQPERQASPTHAPGVWPSSDDDDWLDALHSRMKKEVKTRMLVDGQEVVFQLDTGASLNMIPQTYVGQAAIRPYRGKLRTWD